MSTPQNMESVLCQPTTTGHGGLSWGVFGTPSDEPLDKINIYLSQHIVIRPSINKISY